MTSQNVASIGCNARPKYENRAEAVAAQLHDPESKYVVVVCHRGDWRNCPENSYLAIVSIIQTDRPAQLIEYLQKKGRHSLPGYRK